MKRGFNLNLLGQAKLYALLAVLVLFAKACGEDPVVDPCDSVRKTFNNQKALFNTALNECLVVSWYKNGYDYYLQAGDSLIAAIDVRDGAMANTKWNELTPKQQEASIKSGNIAQSLRDMLKENADCFAK